MRNLQFLLTQLQQTQPVASVTAQLPCFHPEVTVALTLIPGPAGYQHLVPKPMFAQVFMMLLLLTEAVAQQLKPLPLVLPADLY